MRSGVFTTLTFWLAGGALALAQEAPQPVIIGVSHDMPDVRPMVRRTEYPPAAEAAPLILPSAVSIQGPVEPAPAQPAAPAPQVMPNGTSVPLASPLPALTPPATASPRSSSGVRRVLRQGGRRRESVDPA